MDAGEMFEETDSTFMLEPVVKFGKKSDDSKFELLQLEAGIFESIVTVDSSSEYSDYSKASSSRNPSDTGSYPGSKTKRLADSDKILRKRRLPSKSNTPQPTKVAKSDVDKNEDRCDYCNKKGFLICCDYCPAAFHQKCHEPSIEVIPEGQFQCYRCHYKKYYEENPIKSPVNSNDPSEQQKYEFDCFMKELNIMRIVPFTLPDHVKSFVQDIPPIMPNQEFKRKFKRKNCKEQLNDCYICDRSVNFQNSNQCHFCSTTVHLDCDPLPSCSTRLYAWRCPLHIENYLDTYFLDSVSTHRRLKLWSQHTNELDEEKVEKEFVNRMVEENDLDEKMEAAKTLLSLGDKRLFQNGLNNYTEAERRMLFFNKSMFCTELFIENPKAIAAFVPAFKTSILPIVYDGKPLSIGTSDDSTFNLKSLPFDCKNMIGTQLILKQKQEIDYLCCGTDVGGYTRVNGIFLAERPSNSLQQCQCVDLKKIVYKNQQFFTHIAVFPNKIYTIQLGCAFFYLVFNPVLHSQKPRQF